MDVSDAVGIRDPEVSNSILKTIEDIGDNTLIKKIYDLCGEKIQIEKKKALNLYIRKIINDDIQIMFNKNKRRNKNGMYNRIYDEILFQSCKRVSYNRKDHPSIIYAISITYSYFDGIFNHLGEIELFENYATIDDKYRSDEIHFVHCGACCVLDFIFLAIKNKYEIIDGYFRE